MEPLIKELERLTYELVQRIDQADSDELEQFVERRETVINAMQSMNEIEVSTELRERVQRVLHHDRRIVARMHELRDDASTQMQKLDAARYQRSLYEQHYTPDSVFFDKRK